MAWEISISDQGWLDIRATLNDWKLDDLLQANVEAYVCSKLEIWNADENDTRTEEEVISEAYENGERKYAMLSPDSLSASAFEWVKKNNTCDNGGNGYYVDLRGCHKVYVE